MSKVNVQTRMGRHEKLLLELKYFNFGEEIARRRVAKANWRRAAPPSVNLTELEEEVIQTWSVKVTELSEATGDVMYKYI